MVCLLDDSQFQYPTVYAEATWLYGAILNALLYGIVVVLYVLCCHSLWHRRIRSQGPARKVHRFLLVYVNVLFALGTIYVIVNSQVTQLAFINHRDFPGGPSAYEINTASVPLNFTFAASSWCADAMMIWRCIVVYRDNKFHLVVSIFGCLMLLASVVTGTLWVVIGSFPLHSESMTTWMSSSLLFPYLSISLASMIMICILTVLRLLYHRAYISKALGPAYGNLYIGFSAMIIESAAVYSICSLLYIITFAIGSPLAYTFLQVLAEAQVIAPLLITYRVSEGKAWSRDVTTCLLRTISQPSFPVLAQRTSDNSRSQSHLSLPSTMPPC